MAILDHTSYEHLASSRAEDRRTIEEVVRHIDDWLARDPAEFARLTALDRPANEPPNLVAGERPTAEAWEQARELTRRVGLPGLVRYFERLGPEVSLRPGSARESGRRTWQVQLPPSYEDATAQIGLPLIGAFSSDAWDQIVRWRIAAQYRTKIGLQNVNAFRRLVTEAIGVEHALWQLAAAELGLTDFEIPYAFRYQALGWLWHRNAHAGGYAFTLCLRCGELLHRNRPPMPNRQQYAPPLCGYCAKEPAEARTSPPHAIAPAGRGTWWIACQYPGCEFFVKGTRRKTFCGEHAKSRLSRRRRQLA